MSPIKHSHCPVYVSRTRNPSRTMYPLRGIRRAKPKPLLTARGPMASLFDRWFRLREHRTTSRIEVLGGVTTFAAMAYIIVVNPAILENAGIPAGPSTVATILAAAFGTLLM